MKILVLLFLNLIISTDIEKNRNDLKLKIDTILLNISELITDTVKKVDDLDEEIKKHDERFKQTIENINNIANSFYCNDSNE